MKTWISIIDVILDFSIVCLAIVDAWQGNYWYAIFLVLLLIFFKLWK